MRSCFPVSEKRARLENSDSRFSNYTPFSITGKYEITGKQPTYYAATTPCRGTKTGRDGSLSRFTLNATH